MEPLSSQAEPGSDLEAPASSAFRWDVPGRSATVFINFDVVDRLGIEIMLGFGAVPKRGAEVGGILLGRVESGDRLIVHIEDFTGVPCQHLRGPSYVLSNADMQFFDQALERCRRGPDKQIYAVGYYRSNTRELLQLCPEDMEILDSRFQEPSAICLQVKPSATRTSEGTFFFREDGRFPTDSHVAEFPFRRMEMGGGDIPRRPRGAMTQDVELKSGTHPVVANSNSGDHVTAPPARTSGLASEHSDSARATTILEPAARARRGWSWIPISIIFLLLGAVIGFQIALTFPGKQAPSVSADPYTLDLTVVQLGESLHLKWNPDAAAFRTAKRGVLHIQDGDNSKEVELKQEDLSRGGAIYRRASANVRFRLEIFPRDSISVAESVGLRMLETRK